MNKRPTILSIPCLKNENAERGLLLSSQLLRPWCISWLIEESKAELELLKNNKMPAVTTPLQQAFQPGLMVAKSLFSGQLFRWIIAPTFQPF